MKFRNGKKRREKKNFISQIQEIDRIIIIRHMSEDSLLSKN